jgi:ketosteroid isomerase-like protein
MRVTHCVALAAVVAAGPLAAQTSGADSAAVATTVQQFHAALAKGDSGAALALLAPDVVVVEAGGIEDLAEYRAHHLPADIRFVQAIPGTRGPVRVTLAGDVAWATATSEAVGTFDGRAINSAGAELMVLSRTATGWKIRAIHWSSRRRASQ